MINAVENARLHLPAEDPAKPNERIVLHPETNIEQVLVDATGKNLKELLGPQTVISAEKPKEAGVLWAQIKSTRL